MKVSDIFKSLLFLLIILMIAPQVVKNYKVIYKKLTTPHTKVGVIRVEGPLKSPTYYNRQLKKFFEDKSIKAILLKLDSPGGSAGTSQAIFNEINFLKSKHKKAVVAYAPDSCLSGAYYIASASDAIITTAAALVGAIGVYIPQPQFKDFIENWHVKYGVVKTGDFKTANNPFLEPTAAGQKMLQNLTDDSYKQFIEDVSKSRSKLSIKNSKSWADGKIFTGRQAKKLGLIDETGSVYTVEEKIREIAPIEGEIEWIEEARPISFRSIFKNIPGAKSFAKALIETELENITGFCTNPPSLKERSFETRL